eukprot:Gregarina_sp_Poly_1__3936@NODE_2181_length_2539_cov_69_758900_g1406_i0_p1_GENE_NODE_2181_length_2539_cov_69_758900_g1406_i0NODE_2181_length_2539_cov_69_758900_g1406_i0_p1_ORF_typecomplete_len188_score20_94UNC93/PF05978_16/0_072DUF1673/PF07895_11/1_1Wzy_C/PF04932_15/5_3_NODE_2181_length_2539_cov_69_758900_g1406_i012921855
MAQYLTNSPRVLRSRTSIFLLFTLMFITEFLLLRFSRILYLAVTAVLRVAEATLAWMGSAHYLVRTLRKFEDETSVTRQLVVWNRCLFIGVALVVYVRSYCRFRDPQIQLVETVTEKLNTLHSIIEGHLGDDSLSQRTSQMELSSSQTTVGGESSSRWFKPWFGRTSTVSSLQSRKHTDKGKKNRHE